VIILPAFVSLTCCFLFFRLLHGNKEELFTLLFLLFCEEVTLSKPASSSSGPPAAAGDTITAPGSVEKQPGGVGGGVNTSLSRSLSKKQAASIRPTSSTNGNGNNNTVVVAEDENHAIVYPSVDPLITSSNDSSSSVTAVNPVMVNAAASQRDHRSASVTSNRGEDLTSGNDSGKKDEAGITIPSSASYGNTDSSSPPALVSSATPSSQPPPSLATSAMRNSLRDLFRSNNANNPNGSSSSSSASESNSRKLVISHRKIIELLLFMLCMLYHRQSLSSSQKKSISGNSDFLKLVQVLKDLLFNQTTFVTELFSASSGTRSNIANASSNVSSSQQQYYTLSQFLTTIFTPLSSNSTAAPVGPAGEGKGKSVMNKVLSSLCLPRLMVMNIFQPFFYDIVPNPYEVSAFFVAFCLF
jgi:hypothetical protein